MATPDDQMVTEFFKKMKANDQAEVIPEINYLKKDKRSIRRKKRVAIGIAASVVLVLASFLYSADKNVEVPQEKNIADIEKNINSMMSWESATSGLVDK